MEEDDLLFPTDWPPRGPVASAPQVPAPADSTPSTGASMLPRFCGVCGSAWNALWAECAVCVQVKQLPPPVPLADQRRPIVSGLVFYFMFLLVSVGAIIASVAGVAEFNVQVIA